MRGNCLFFGECHDIIAPMTEKPFAVKKTRNKLKNLPQQHRKAAQKKPRTTGAFTVGRTTAGGSTTADGLTKADGNTLVFKRSHLYTVLLPLAFVLGLGVGFLFWGRQPAPKQQQAARRKLTSSRLFSAMMCPSTMTLRLAQPMRRSPSSNSATSSAPTAASGTPRSS